MEGKMSTFPMISKLPAESRRVVRRLSLLCLCALLLPGCTALHPIRGVPASYLPEQFHGPSRDNKRTIDLSLLVRTPPDQYRVEAGDILAIYVPRVLGSQPTEVASVGIEPPINMPATTDDPPTIGYPIQVRDDNTISLPQIPPLHIGGLTLHEVELAIRKAYTVDFHILNPEEAMVMVSLQRPRIHRVMVVRQETMPTLTTSSAPGMVNIGTSGKGTARIVTLKAYENDVLHALALTEGVDGLPGLNAENAIYIIRRRISPTPPEAVPQPLPGSIPPAIPEVPPVPIAPIPEIIGHTEVPTRQIEMVSYQPDGSPYGGYRSSSNTGMTGGENNAATPVPSLAQTQYSGPSLTPQPEMGHSWAPSGQEPVPTPVPMGPASLPQPLPPPELPPGDAGFGMMLQNFDPTIDNPNVIRIPVRLGPGEDPRIDESQIILHDGDIVFIESRETEVFYTAGLLGGGQYTLPRDYDLGILEAVAIAEGRGGMAGTGLSRSIGGVSALNHDVANGASRLAILRTLPNGQRITIEIDLRKAMKYQQENIRVQPGDILFLEYTLPEAICAFTQRYLLEGALFGVAAGVLTSGGGG
jgi:protein involved in polysaccharide export with SLBB domain